MSEFDNDALYGNKGLLEINTEEAESELRLTMFANVLTQAKQLDVRNSRVIENIINYITDEQNNSYDRCHVDTFIKGIPSFRQSYQKNC